jgi:hypothetical protein
MLEEHDYDIYLISSHFRRGKDSGGSMRTVVRP